MYHNWHTCLSEDYEVTDQETKSLRGKNYLKYVCMIFATQNSILTILRAIHLGKTKYQSGSADSYAVSPI